MIGDGVRGGIGLENQRNKKIVVVFCFSLKELTVLLKRQVVEDLEVVWIEFRE